MPLVPLPPSVCMQPTDETEKWKTYLLRHLRNFHGAKYIKQTGPPRRLRGKQRVYNVRQSGGKSRRFANRTAVGSKQFLIMRALINADRMLRKCTDDYLQESACILRNCLSTYTGKVDRATVKLLTRTAIKFVPQDEGDAPLNLRIGTMHVTKGFAELYFNEFLMCDMRTEKARHRLVIHFLRCGCTFAELLPTARSTFWIQLIERILYSPAMQNRKKHYCWNVQTTKNLPPSAWMVSSDQ